MVLMFLVRIVSHQTKDGPSMEQLTGSQFQIKRAEQHHVILQPRIPKTPVGVITHQELMAYMLHPHTHRLQVSLYPRNPDLMD